MRGLFWGIIGGMIGGFAINRIEDKIAVQTSRRFVLKQSVDDGTGVITTYYLKPDLTTSTNVEDAQVFNGIEIKQALNNPLFASYVSEELQSAALGAVYNY
jgi:hypothetical protein